MNNRTATVLVFLLAVCAASSGTKYEYDIDEFEYVAPSLSFDSISCTVYNAFDPNQGWGDGSITASGKKIDPLKLKNGEIKYIAISHDLREYFSFGDSVWVDIPNSTLSGVYYIEDLMHKRWHRKIDLLTYDLKLGKWNNVTITKL